MKKIVFLIKMIIVTSVFGLIFVGCESPDKDVWTKIMNKTELDELAGVYEANKTYNIPADDLLPAYSYGVNMKVAYKKGDDSIKVNAKINISAMLDALLSEYGLSSVYGAKDLLWAEFTNGMPKEMVKDKYYIVAPETLITLDEFLLSDPYVNQYKNKIKVTVDKDFISSMDPTFDSSSNYEPMEMIFYKK